MNPMRRALDASIAAWGTTSPNPAVGAVVVDAAGTVVAVGATQPPGGPHAEVVALRQAGEAARGATLYVTLEPCNHHGRTPPCTQAIIDAGIAEVHYAVADPSADAGGGAAALRHAGIVARQGEMADQVHKGPLRGWLHVARTGRPHVTWKYAATLDGRVAAADGTSQWITGPAARADVHELRSHMDAIVAGTGTVAADDPHLTARQPDGMLRERQPLRVVVGKSTMDPSAKVFDDAADTVQLHTHDPDTVLADLAAKGVVDVLLEGGPTLAGAFAKADRIDRIIGYLAPSLMGDGPSALAGAGVHTIADLRRWTIEEIMDVDGDIRLSAVPSWR